MSRSTDTRMVQCPGCDLKLPADDGRAQVRHMEENHPEIYEKRLRDAGIVPGRHGGFVDLLADPNS